MIRQEVAAACFRSRPPRPPQPKRVSVDPSPGLPPSIRPRRSPRTCPATPADFRAPPNARPSNPHRPSPLAVAISAARGFPPSEAFRRRPFSPRPSFCVGPASETLNETSRLLREYRWSDTQRHTDESSVTVRSEHAQQNAAPAPERKYSRAICTIAGWRAGSDPVVQQAFLVLDHVAGQRRADRLDPEPLARRRQGLVGPRQLRRTF